MLLMGHFCLQSRMASAASGGSLLVDKAAIANLTADKLHEVIPEAPEEGEEPTNLD